MNRACLLIAVLCLVGCATTGSIANLSKGTTKQELLSTFGQPTSKEASSEGEVWIYRFCKEGGPEVLKLTIHLEDDKVKDFEGTVSKRERPRRPFPPRQFPPFRRFPPR